MSMLRGQNELHRTVWSNFRERCFFELFAPCTYLPSVLVTNTATGCPRSLHKLEGKTVVDFVSRGIGERIEQEELVLVLDTCDRALRISSKRSLA